MLLNVFFFRFPFGVAIGSGDSARSLKKSRLSGQGRRGSSANERPWRTLLPRGVLGPHRRLCTKERTSNEVPLCLLLQLKGSSRCSGGRPRRSLAPLDLHLLSGLRGPRPRPDRPRGLRLRDLKRPSTRQPTRTRPTRGQPLRGSIRPRCRGPSRSRGRGNYRSSRPETTTAVPVRGPTGWRRVNPSTTTG